MLSEKPFIASNKTPSGIPLGRAPCSLAFRPEQVLLNALSKKQKSLCGCETLK
jgi:hypothetical protein